MIDEVFISIKPKFASLIERREKNYEFRKYIPKQSPTKLWMYVTAPVAKLKYIAHIDKITTYPQKINANGFGNEDFNNGLKKSKHAYRIKHFYRIKKPISLHELKSKFGFTAPQGYAYTTKYSELDKHVGKNCELLKIF